MMSLIRSRIIGRSGLALAAVSLVTLLLVMAGWWQGTAANAQVQVPMFYDAHYLYPRPWTQEQAAPGVPHPAAISALYGPNQVSQPFVSGIDRLAMIRLWLSGPVGTPVAVTLTGAGRTMGGEIHLDSPDGRDYFLTFPPIPGSAGERFTLTLQATEARPEQPVTTRAVGGDRLGGSVYLNEYARPGNLALTTYARGPAPGGWWLGAVAEQILPDLFVWRIQQYKPAAGKGAIFPALLGVTLLLSLTFLFVARPAPRATPTGQAWGAAVLLALFLLWQLADGRLRLPGLTPTVGLQPVDAALTPITVSTGEKRLVHDLSLTLWTAAREPEPRFATWETVDGRGAISAPAGGELGYSLVVPRQGELRVGLAPEPGGTVQYQVRFGGTLLAERAVRTEEPLYWLTVDLSPWAGQSGELILASEGETGRARWVMPQIRSETDWLLAALPPAATPVDYEFGPGVRLLGYEAAADGADLIVTLYWQTEARVDSYPTIFVHLLDGNGQLVAQHDGQPVDGTYPLAAWPPESIIVDRHRLPGGGAVGGGQLAVGLYNPSDLSRWPVRDGAGAAWPDGRALLELP